MNVERFHAIVNELLGEVRQTEYPSLLDQLVGGLRNVATDPNAQQQVSQARVSLSEALGKAPSNDLSPAWREALVELGVGDLVGDALADRVEEILSRNEITPSAAADELAEIQERVEEFTHALTQASAALEFFEVGAEELKPGEFEIGFLIPREAVEDELGRLGEEFIQLKQIVAPIMELAGESRPDMRVRSISSSEFEVFLHSAPAVAWMFTKVIDQLLASYQRLLDIRQKHRELAENDNVPDEVLKDLAEYAGGMMEEKIEEIVNKAISEAKIDDEARLNELRNELRLRLDALADRIDRGYNVEVRTGELPPPPDPEDPDAVPEITLEPETRQAAEGVLARQKQLQFMNVSGKPILHLEQPEDGSGEDPGGEAR